MTHRFRVVLIGALLVVAALGLFGAPVSSELRSGGYDDPGSESFKAQQILQDRFHLGGNTVVFEITDDSGADSVAAQRRAREIVNALRASDSADHVVSYLTTPEYAASLHSADGRTGLVVAQVLGDDSQAPDRAHSIAQPFVGDRDGVSVKAGGQAIASYEANARSHRDAQAAEMIAIPITLMVLIWAFGSVIAAALPIVVAISAVSGTFAALRIIAHFTPVSVYAINIATPLCLALAIDYSLLIVGRYREEVGGGGTREDVIERTLQSAGRAVVFSGLTVALALAPMAAFPVYFLRSLAYAGLASVALCLVGTLVVAPALIVALGDNIDRWDMRKLIRRLFGRPTPEPRPLEATYWYKFTAAVTSRRWLAILIVTPLLLLMGSPFLGAKFGYPDDRILPTSSSSRQVGDDLRTQFAQNSTGDVRIVMPNCADVGKPVLEDYAIALSQVANVTAVSSPGGTYAAGRNVTPASSTGTGIGGDGSDILFTVSTTSDPFSSIGKTQLMKLKSISAPCPTLFSGLTQQNIDNVNGILKRAPIVLALIALTSFILLFLFTGSILIPIKAIILNMLSLTVAFGALVWIFQEGHLNGMGTTATGYLPATVPPLIFCVAFGLSMDYEVFVLSRIREEWLRSDRSAAANESAVIAGLARTGRIVTTAAAIMAIVFVATIPTAGVSMVKMIGLGLAVTVLVDAFVIRTILVPAFMALVGRANWWAPTVVADWHTRFGLTEHHDARPSSPSVKR